MRQTQRSPEGPRHLHTSDLRKLLSVPLRSQGHCGFGRIDSEQPPGDLLNKLLSLSHVLQSGRSGALVMSSPQCIPWALQLTHWPKSA